MTNLSKIAANESPARIVACVNACEGISTEDLESGRFNVVGRSEALIAVSDGGLLTVTEQRDDLLAALERISQGNEFAGRVDYSPADVVHEYVRIASRAIAKVRGVIQ